MLNARLPRSFFLLICFSLLVELLLSSAMAQDIAVNLSEFKTNIITQDCNVSYLYLGKELSNITELLSHISDLDECVDSPVRELVEHIEQGFLFAEYNDVVAILEYAITILQKKYVSLDRKYADSIVNHIELIMHQIVDGALSIDSGLITRAPHLRTLVIDENIDVLGESVFHKHIKTKQGIHALGKLKVGKSAKFKKNVKIKGSLSVTDLVVESCMDNLCVNNLSTTDIAISGTLSANDAFIVNGLIQNLTITTSVLDSITNNLTVNATLSVNDEILNGNLRLTALTPAGVLHNDVSGNISSSLIVNADISPSAGIADNKLAIIASAGKVANSATTGTSSDLPNTLVLRDGSGNFSASTITATLNGNATTATTVINFSGPLLGDVTGTQGATVVSFVGGQSASDIANATVSANSGTNMNIPSTFIERDSTGSFAAGIVSVVDTVVSNNIILSANPSTSISGNILKGADVFISNFGTNNTFIGINSGNFTLSGNNNIGFGVAALSNCTSGSNNIVIGLDNVTTTGSNNIYLGADVVVNEFNVIRIGNEATQCYIAGINGAATGAGSGVLINANGQLGSTVSSRKFKHNIISMSDVSENIYKLNPVEFAYNEDTSETMQFGLIAEEVEATFPALVVYDKNNQPYSVQYHLLPVLLLNEIKKQYVTIDNLTMTIEKMNDVIDNLQTDVNGCMQRINAMEDQVKKDSNETY